MSDIDNEIRSPEDTIRAILAIPHPDEALEAWCSARLQFPQYSVFWAHEIASLLVVGRHEDAENRARDALKNFPGHIDIIAQAITAFIYRQNWVEATCLVKAMSEEFADHPYVRKNGATIRRDVARGLSGISDETLAKLALEAESKNDWSISVTIREILLDRRPSDNILQAVLARALFHAGEVATAETYLDKAIEFFVDNEELAVLHALCATRKGDTVVASKRWDDISVRFPQSLFVLRKQVETLVESKAFDKVRPKLAALLESSPDDIELRIWEVKVAEGQGEWTQAVSLWDRLAMRYPDNHDFRNGWARALGQAQFLSFDAASTVLSAPLEGTGNAADTPAQKILALRFEGLGDHCEFGLVQRHMGAEPLSLFRFTAVSAATLTKLLGESLEPLGDPEFTEVVLTQQKEYMLRDTRDFYMMHCFLHEGEIEAETLRKQQIRRIGFLRRKLIDDLERGDKVFVHKSSHSRIENDVAVELQYSLRAYNDNNVLLVIRHEEVGHESGTVEVLRPGLLVGYLGGLYGQPLEDIDFQSWHKILVRADQYRAAYQGEQTEEQGE
mgnify:CR=1 FL=1